MTVLYYTQTYHLDAAIETIKALQNDGLELHLIIEITPESKRSNIININKLDKTNALSNFNTLLGDEKAKAFEPYFKSLKSIHFLVFKAQKAFSLDTINTLKSFLKLLYKIKPKVIHFDTITLRSLFLVPFIFSFKKIITIHDPIPHIGDANWKTNVTKLFYFKFANKFIFYSNYAKKQFEEYYPIYKQPKYLIQFQPFTFNQLFLNPIANHVPPSCILFFGRISYYKGIDILIEAIPKILKKYPKQVFVIAGRSEGYILDYQFFKKYEHNVLLLNKYITPKEAVHLIQKSKFLICPYRDASQSGVLMTASAIGKSVIATSVGAFPEYIQHDVNGLIAEPTCSSLVEKVLYSLDNNRFKMHEQHIQKNYSSQIAFSNQTVLMQAYSTN